MNRNSWTWLCAGIALASLLGTASAEAPDAANQFATPAPRDADRAAAIARKNTGGRVLDVRLMDEDDSSRAYAVRLLVDPGRVRTVVVDSDSEQLR